MREALYEKLFKAEFRTISLESLWVREELENPQVALRVSNNVLTFWRARCSEESMVSRGKQFRRSSAMLFKILSSLSWVNSSKSPGTKKEKKQLLRLQSGSWRNKGKVTKQANSSTRKNLGFVPLNKGTVLFHYTTLCPYIQRFFLCVISL